MTTFSINSPNPSYALIHEDPSPEEKSPRNTTHSEEVPSVSQSSPSEEKREQPVAIRKKTFFIRPKDVQPILQTTSKTSKAIRTTVKASELLGHPLVGKGAKQVLKKTIILKPMRAPFRIQKFCRHVQALKKSESTPQKIKTAASVARDVKSLAISGAMACEFAENFGLSHVTGWIPYLDSVLPLVKFAPLGICMNKLKKAHTLSSKVTSILNEMRSATDRAQTEQAVANGLIKLQGLGLEKLQNTLGFAKDSNLTARVAHLQQQLLNPKEKRAAIQSAPPLFEAVESRARIYYYIQGARAIGKGMKLTGSLLNLTGVAVIPGKIMQYGGTVMNFLNWAGQKLFWKGAKLPPEVIPA